MSGGKERKSSRSSKTQGWEEAGAEFYQESYPGDLEGLQRDPSKLATLLPSKQNRNATTRRTLRSSSSSTSHQYTYSKGGSRRRPSSGSGCNVAPHMPTTTIRTTAATVTRRGSQYQEVQVAMLPDLSENMTDEERTWDEIREIKAMPVPMAQKKEMKSQLQVSEGVFDEIECECLCQFLFIERHKVTTSRFGSVQVAAPQVLAAFQKEMVRVVDKNGAVA